jgi:hypothetical protein
MADKVDQKWTKTQKNFTQQTAQTETPLVPAEGIVVDEETTGRNFGVGDPSISASLR